MRCFIFSLNRRINQIVSFVHEEFLLWDENNLDHQLKNTIILLDNWKVHKSKSTTDFLLNNNATYFSLYSLEIASIEFIFRVLKKRLLEQILMTGIKYNMRNRERKIREAFATISKSEIIGIFNNWFKIIFKYSH